MSHDDLTARRLEFQRVDVDFCLSVETKSSDDLLSAEDPPDDKRASNGVKVAPGGSDSDDGLIRILMALNASIESRD